MNGFVELLQHIKTLCHREVRLPDVKIMMPCPLVFAGHISKVHVPVLYRKALMYVR